MNNSIESPHDWDSLRATIARRGVLINILVPFLLLAVGYLFRKLGMLPEFPTLDESAHNLLLYILGAVAVGEIAVAFYLRKILFQPARFMATNRSFAAFAEICANNVITVFALGASPSIYGFVLYALGGTIEQFIFFILIALIAYRAVRPDKELLEKLWENVRMPQ